jgi:hypothetical protein
MKRAILCFLVTALATVLVLASNLPVIKAAEGDNGEVRFRGTVVTDEQWGDTACYGSYCCYVLLQEVISDPNNLLSDPLEQLPNSSVVFIAYGNLVQGPLNLTIGESVECYGYYYYLSAPLQCYLKIVCKPWQGANDYYVVRVSQLGDVDHDSDVDILDIVQCARAYGSTPSDPNWNIYCDMASPYWTVDISDIVTAAGHYGQSW